MLNLSRQFLPLAGRQLRGVQTTQKPIKSVFVSHWRLQQPIMLYNSLLRVELLYLWAKYMIVALLYIAYLCSNSYYSSFLFFDVFVIVWSIAASSTLRQYLGFFRSDKIIFFIFNIQLLLRVVVAVCLPFFLTKEKRMLSFYLSSSFFSWVNFGD